MLSHELLDEEKRRFLISKLDKDQHLLFYSYLSQRADRAIFIGQYVETQLTAVLAYTDELSFPAFSFYCIDEKNIDLPALVRYTRAFLDFSDEEICGTILSQTDFQLFQSCGLIKNKPQAFIQMKHVEESRLVLSDRVSRVEEAEYSMLTQFIKENGMKYFARKELELYPFLAIKDGNSFASAGGFHFFDQQLVEIGNIVTHTDYRGQGLATLLTSELTFLGRKKANDVYLGVFANNHVAIRLYERIGYESTASLWIVDFTLSNVPVSLASE